MDFLQKEYHNILKQYLNDVLAPVHPCLYLIMVVFSQKYFMLQGAPQRVINQEASSQDNMLQDRLQNLQHFIDTRDQVW